MARTNSLYQMPRSALLVRCLLEQRRHRDGALHGLVVLHSQAHAKALYDFLQTLEGEGRTTGFEYVALEGHADVVELRERFRASWKEDQDQVIVASALAALYLFCLGLTQMSELDFIIFDDLTPANYHHPYCVIMESFYSPLLSSQLSTSILSMKAPRILGFASWPRKMPGEVFQLKLIRIKKLRQYQRTFHAQIVPIKVAEDETTGNWMDDEEVEEATIFRSPFSSTRTIVVEGPAAVDRYMDKLEKTDGSFVFDLSNPDHGLNVDEIITSSTAVVFLPIKKETAILEHPQHLHVLTQFVDAATQMVFVTDDAAALGTILSALLALSTLTADGRRQRANDLRSFFFNFETLSKASTFLLPQTIHHWKCPASSALLMPAVGVQLLLGICSYFPKRPNIKHLSIRVLSVKRLDVQGQVIDKRRHYYVTRIKLPRILALLNRPGASETTTTTNVYILKEKLSITGPLTYNRFSSLAAAACEAIKRLYEFGLIDANFIPIPELVESYEAPPEGCDMVRREELAMIADQYDDVSSSDNEVEEPSAAKSLEGSIKEIIPDDLRFDHQWDRTDPPAHFCVYVFEYDTRPHNVDADLSIASPSCDTQICLSDLNFFSSQRSGYSMAILLPTALEHDLRQIQINLGAHLNMVGTLTKSQEIDLHRGQVDTLIEFQVVLYGIINPRPLNVPEEAERLAPESYLSIPEGKKSAFLLAIVKDGSRKIAPPSFEEDWEKYEEFCRRAKSITAKELFCVQLNNVEARDQPGLVSSPDKTPTAPPSWADRQTKAWELDWDLMSSMIRQEDYSCLEPITDKINGDLETLDHPSAAAAAAAAAPPPSFITSPDKPPTVVDYKLFLLRRLVLYAPHSGIFYRIKTWHPELKPSSPFVSKTFPECHSYAEYAKLKYGLEVSATEKGGLAETRRVENFMDISQWTASGTRASPQGRRHQGQSKSLMIPSICRVLPIPYALVRLLLLVPRMVFELEWQLLAIQCFRDRFAALRPSWPPGPLMIEAMTCTLAATGYNYERLEILGDSILKLFNTIDYFLTERFQGEGRLSTARQEQTCNLNLLQIATNLCLPSYARLTPYIYKLFSPPAIRSLLNQSVLDRWPFVALLFDDGAHRWLAVSELDQRADRRSVLFHLLPDGELVKTEERAHESIQMRHRHQSRTPLEHFTRLGMSIPLKTLADLIEALIAAFYLGPAGLQGALDLLIHLGLCSERMRTFTQLDDVMAAAGASYGSHDEQTKMPIALVTPAETMPVHPAPYTPDEASFPFEAIEKTINYQFVHRRLLFLACTHPSVDASHNYQRLEWLGDAALDWVVMKYFWEGFTDTHWMTPDRLTKARQTAVCNEAFARIAVSLGLYHYLRIASPSLQLEIGSFVPKCQRAELEHRQILDAPAPKALGDLLESIAGAVFLDLKFDIAATVTVLFPLLHPFLLEHVDPYDLPGQPLHQFWHAVRVANLSGRVDYRYEPEEPVLGQPSTCYILIRGRTIGSGMGANRFMARNNAARQATSYIQSQGWKEIV